MATGYTHRVWDGTVSDFPTFATICARAMGACILMRDDPASAPIPEQFQFSDYHEKAAIAARARHAQLLAFTEDEKSAAFAAHLAALASNYEDRKAEVALSRARYEAMLAQVHAWTLPSPDHQQFKAFMVEQLESSIKHDCYEPDVVTPPTFDEWWAETIGQAAHSIGYHEKSDAEERARTDGRNLWVRQLRESFQAQPA